MNRRQYEKLHRNRWYEAQEAINAHFREHTEARAWYPLGTKERLDADLRAKREYNALKLVECLTRERYRTVLIYSGLVPLSNGLCRKLDK